MNRTTIKFLFIILLFVQCKSNHKDKNLTKEEKEKIISSIQTEINIIIQAVNNKDIKTYMKKMPDDFVIYDNSGEIISREKQREYTLRDWSIIEKTLNNEMNIDSINFVSNDSLYVYTSQKWKRIMYRKDGTTKDTILTTQLHKELWKKRKNGWIGYDVEELGGEVYINGLKYNPN